MTLIDRRAFITMLGGSILAAPLAAGAQSTRTPRVGILFNASPTTVPLQLEAYRRGLRELGWIEGQTVMIEYRWAEGNPDRLPGLASQFEELITKQLRLLKEAVPKASRVALL